MRNNHLELPRENPLSPENKITKTTYQDSKETKDTKYSQQEECKIRKSGIPVTIAEGRRKSKDDFYINDALTKKIDFTKIQTLNYNQANPRNSGFVYKDGSVLE